MKFKVIRNVRWWIIPSLIVAVLMITIFGLFYMGWLSNDGDAKLDVSILLSSSVVALVGVTVTGYIFSTESLRQLGDDDYKYSHCAERNRSVILKKVKWQFIMAIILISLLAMIAYIDISNSGALITVEAISAALFSFFLIWSIILDIEMMDLNKGLDKYARILLEETAKKLSDPVIHLNPEEYSNLVLKNGLTGIPEFMVRKPSNGVEAALIKAVRGKEAQHYAKTKSDSDVIAYRDMADEFNVESSLTVFEGIEGIICRLAGTSGSLRNDERKTIEAVLGVGSGRKEDSGMCDDIVRYYFNISEFRDNLFVVTKKEEEQALPARALDPPADASFCSDKLYLKNEVEHKGDCPLSTGKTALEYLRDATSSIYVLRYELCKKLEGRTLSNMNLSDFDFSYGILRKCILDNSILLKSSFYCCDLTGANLIGCDMTDAVMENSDCTEANLARSKIRNATFKGSRLDGIVLDGAALSNCAFPKNNGKGITLQSSSVVETLFKSCYFPDSDMSKSSLVMNSFDGCIFKDCDISHAKISSCDSKECDFYGSDFTGSTLNFTTFKRTSFMMSKFENVEMTSDILIENSFINCQMKKVNLSGTEIFSCTFNSAQMSDCDFTRTMVMTLGIPNNTKQLFEDKGTASCPITIDNNSPEGMNDFTNSFMNGCLFTDTILTYSDLRFAILQKCIFSHALVENCLMDNCNMMDQYIAESDFLKVSLRCATFHDSRFTKCGFLKCNFETADLSNVTVTESSFDHCIINNADLKETKLITTTWNSCDMTYIMDNLTSYFVDITLTGNCIYNFKDANNAKHEINIDGHYPILKSLEDKITEEVKKIDKTCLETIKKKFENKRKNNGSRYGNLRTP
ncbi:MAG: pentapeptide repeat-containing protein [Candidatus Methanomethylophilaceae archaeon]|nr:pentapeptide repeat-containing protein [Candidatus Methanomethylophilaceae archaeon]